MTCPFFTLLIEEQHCKAKCHRFNSSWGQWDFSVT
jgi:hypothetical protein